MNYSELKTAVADTLNRSDLTSVVPTFIELAHADLQGRLRVRQMITRGTLTLAGEYTSLPSDWLQMDSVKVDATRRRLERRSETEIDEREAEAGSPLWYTVTGDEIRVWPAPTSEDVTVVYYAEIPDLSDSNTSNWLLAEAPDAYLYGALLHSAPYLQEDERLQAWDLLYSAAVKRVQMASARSNLSGGMRVR